MATDQSSLDGVDGASEDYAGVPWRARFLRAPKVALDLAAHPSFTPLDSFATVKLGLKTGADSFFFVERVKERASEATLLPQRGTVTVRGKNGWTGQIANADLIPAVLNPHQLMKEGLRCLTVPKNSKHFYLYPRPGKLRHDLPDYIKLGEMLGIHQKDLVASNGSESAWFKQVRTLVRSSWALPYNSAYEYGAWRNPQNFVLNGRFVGVEPRHQDHSELIGAVLNSTFAALQRLIEGVATGVEGATDVGPPAARRVMLPDIRKFNEPGAQKVLEAFNVIVQEDVMPAAPKGRGAVPPSRAELDTAILTALGMTRGQAAALLDRVYASYGRWRTTVEEVELAMRSNRKQMSASGVTRNQSPVEVAGRRVWEEMKHSLPLFPKAYLADHEVLEIINVPTSAQIPTSKPLFDPGIIRTKNRAINLGSFERVSYVAVLREVGISGAIQVPLSGERAGAMADQFVKELAAFSKSAADYAARYAPGKSAVKDVVERARKLWFAECRKSYHGLGESDSNATLKKRGLN